MLTKRSQQQELLDLGPNFYSIEEYNDCMQKLFQINKFFGFFRDTVAILKKLPKSISLMDVGCGGGLFLLHLHKIFPKMKLLGIDIASQAIALAQSTQENWKKNSLVAANVKFQLEKLPLYFPEKSVDVVLATLVCHHLSEEELIIFLRQAQSSARKMIILNDLHRHSWAYRGYAFICPLLFRNRLIIHDGLISIHRGFIRSEWQALLRRAGIEHYQIKWRFPFRWQVIIAVN